MTRGEGRQLSETYSLVKVKNLLPFLLKKQTPYIISFRKEFENKKTFFEKLNKRQNPHFLAQKHKTLSIFLSSTLFFIFSFKCFLGHIYFLRELMFRSFLCIN